MGSTTPEFRTLITCTPVLSNAVKPHILSLSHDLLSEGFIAQENYDRLNNEMIDSSHRASQLVSLIRTRVQLNATNFIKFIAILLRNAANHRDLLNTLDEKYQSLGKGFVFDVYSWSYRIGRCAALHLHFLSLTIVQLQLAMTNLLGFWISR